MERLAWTLSLAFVALVSGAARAAIISSNNTGSPSPILILDWDGPESDPGVSDSGGGGLDSDEGDRVYGNLARWAEVGHWTRYTFTGLAEGDYRIFATWLHDAPRTDANGSVSANGSFVGEYDGVNTPTDIGGIDISQGFIAQKDLVVDPNGSPFQYIGIGTVGPFDSTLVVIVSSSGGSFRSDAIAIQYVPEPTNAALAALGPLALMVLARRWRRTAPAGVHS